MEALRMNLKDIYELIPLDLLKEWAQAVKFNEEIINSQFPKYQNWSDKAVYADYLMDYVDEGFNVENNSYPKAVSLQGKKLPKGNFLEIYKLYFDSSSEEEYPSDSPHYIQWQKRLEQMAESLKKSDY
jgi:hypothetical protein